MSDLIELRRQVHQAQERIDAMESSGAAADRMARTLQDSLLPPVIARPGWLDAAVLYPPAGNGEAVVGNFYDLFPTRQPWWCAALGDALLLYTDGVTEAHSRGGHAVWGLPALSTLLDGGDGLNAEQTLERITTTLSGHAGTITATTPPCCCAYLTTANRCHADRA